MWVWLWVLLAALAGVAVELGIGKLGGEAWDNDAYWTLGVPGMIVWAGVCGVFAREGGWAVGYAPFAGQLVTMLIETSSDYSMLPLGVMLMGAMGLPAVGAAFVGAAVGRRLLGGRVASGA